MKFGVRLDKGQVRETNEDSCCVLAGYPGVPLTFIIADGMGGHNSGEVASKTAVDYASNHILEFPESLSDEKHTPTAIKELMKNTNYTVYGKSKEQEIYNGMGTTLIIAIISNRKLFIGHIGDSRVYLVRNGEIHRVTTDHSFIEELIKSGSITKEEAERHPKRNIITRAIGCQEEVEADTYICDIKENDIIILCTDGLTNMLSEEEILEVVENTDDPEIACEALIHNANERGGQDNITVIVFKND